MITTGKNDDGVKLVPHFPIDVLRKILERKAHTTSQDLDLFEDLIRRGVPPIVNSKFFACMLGVSPKLLHAMTHVPVRYYRTFSIPKRSGGTRTISSPRVFLKAIQKWILVNILYSRSLPDHVTGFSPGKSIIHNAKFHVGKSHLMRIDIEDFFPSIGQNEVEHIFESFGYRSEIAILLSRLSTLDGVLPQGAPTSPYMANLVFLRIDEIIQILANEQNVTYSRYADDLTFSSDEPFTADFLGSIEKTIMDAGFRINRNKFLKVGKGQRHITTGFVVNEKVHPLRTFRKRLRAKFYEAEKDPKVFQKDHFRMQGWAAYVNMYDTELGKKYLLTSA